MLPDSPASPFALLPIDSFYLRELVEVYDRFPGLAAGIWPGMAVCPVCIFRQGGPAILFRHPQPPEPFQEMQTGIWIARQRDVQIFGNSQVTLNEVLTATADYGTEENGPLAFFAKLYHEIHHVYQRTQMPHLRYDNPVQVMTYPESEANDALKIFENRLLLDLILCEDPGQFQESLDIFYTCRMRRQAQIGEFRTFESSAESIEGPAAY